MRFSSKRFVLGGAGLVASWLALGACNGTPVAVVDDDAGDTGAEGGESDATSEAPTDSTVDAPEASTGSDGSMGEAGTIDAPTVSDGGVDQASPFDASTDASESGAAESGADAGGTDAGGADAADEGSTGDAGGSGDDGGAEGGPDSAAEAAVDASADAPAEAAVCSFAGLWNMTVQTVTAVPTFCQGIMDCTNCGWQFNATSTQPTATTIDWSGVAPGGTLCNAFSGPITPSGQFQTDETDCSPIGNGSTFDGQIDVPTCSLTATYVYVLSTCTVTMTMTGSE